VRLPDFICVGPARTGTTWLHAALSGHVALPGRIKETRFWGPYYDKGLDWYAGHFRHCVDAPLVGEACPYFSMPHARERIAEHIPDCKIIITLRDPVDRSYSQYRMLRRIGVLKGSFEEELDYHLIVGTNRYAFHLRGWMELFGDNLKILLFDDLRKNPQQFLDQVCEFIGAPAISLRNARISQNDINSYKYMPHNRRIARRASRMMDFMRSRRAYRTMNFLERIGFWEMWLASRRTFPPLSPATEHRLREQLLPEIDAVEALTGLDLTAWREHSENVNRWLETAPKQKRPALVPGRREIAAIALALIPLATGAVPDGLDLSTMKFSPTQVNSVLEDSDDDVDEGMIFALT
jgi:hypothetical protein